MSDHDAASVVGQMAGLGDELRPPPKPVPPGRLIAAFCGNEANGVATGFCGYNGTGGDTLTSGFDDGYSFLGWLQERGWRSLHAKGDWPYLVYMAWTGPTEGVGEVLAIAEYCEADLTVWTFETRDELKAHYASLKDCP
jgi:hypothetical protein